MRTQASATQQNILHAARTSLNQCMNESEWSMVSRGILTVLPQLVISYFTLKSSGVLCTCTSYVGDSVTTLIPQIRGPSFSPIWLAMWVSVTAILRLASFYQHVHKFIGQRVARAQYRRVSANVPDLERNAGAEDAAEDGVSHPSEREEDGNHSTSPRRAAARSQQAHVELSPWSKERCISSFHTACVLVGFVLLFLSWSKAVPAAPDPALFPNSTEPSMLYTCSAVDSATLCGGAISPDDSVRATSRLTLSMLHWFELLLFLDTLQQLFPFCLVGVCLVPLLCCCIPMTIISVLLCVGLLRKRKRKSASSRTIPGVRREPYHSGLSADEAHRVCAICLVDFEDGVPVSQLPCDGRHVFHQECIDTWLAINTTCPTCRYELLPRRPASSVAGPESEVVRQHDIGGPPAAGQITSRSSSQQLSMLGNASSSSLSSS